MAINDLLLSRFLCGLLYLFITSVFVIWSLFYFPKRNTNIQSNTITGKQNPPIGLLCLFCVKCVFVVADVVVDLIFCLCRMGGLASCGIVMLARRWYFICSLFDNLQLKIKTSHYNKKSPLFSQQLTWGQLGSNLAKNASSCRVCLPVNQ